MAGVSESSNINEKHLLSIFEEFMNNAVVGGSDHGDITRALMYIAVQLARLNESLGMLANNNRMTQDSEVKTKGGCNDN